MSDDRTDDEKVMDAIDRIYTLVDDATADLLSDYIRAHGLAVRIEAAWSIEDFAGFLRNHNLKIVKAT